MGIFSRRIKTTYDGRTATSGVLSPYAPTPELGRLIIDDVLAGQLKNRTEVVDRPAALRIGAVKKAHSIVTGLVAGVPLYQMDNDQRSKVQPEWLTNSASGVSPYHRMLGVAGDLFFEGWSLLAFTEDRSDCMHVPFGLWGVKDDGTIVIDEGRGDVIPKVYHARPVAISYGPDENGLLTDGADTLTQARKIEAAYSDRLENPIPLTVLTVAADRWDSWSPEERKQFLDAWKQGRTTSGGSTALKPEWVSVDMPGQVAVDLFETGRNGSRIDIANHVGLPVSMIEGVRQGGSGGGVEMKYSGVGEGGTQRNEVWVYGSPRRMLSAIEHRLSLDDVCDPGLSIRGDLDSILAAVDPRTNPTSED